MNEDETTISIVNKLSEAMSNACNRRYKSALGCLEEAEEWLEILRDEYEFCMED